MSDIKSFNAALFFTVLRLVVAPILMPVLIVYWLPLNNYIFNGIMVALFAFFALTDFFDGYYARKLKQETPLGKMLDPLADKMFVVATLLALMSVGKIALPWVLILVLRELWISGLREISLQYGFQLPVSYLAKWKTTFQLFFIAVVLLQFSTLYWLEVTLLAATIYCSVLSAMRYTKQLVMKLY